jgi:hypothetical protein
MVTEAEATMWTIEWNVVTMVTVALCMAWPVRAAFPYPICMIGLVRTLDRALGTPLANCTGFIVDRTHVVTSPECARPMSASTETRFAPSQDGNDQPFGEYIAETYQSRAMWWAYDAYVHALSDTHRPPSPPSRSVRIASPQATPLRLFPSSTIIDCPCVFGLSCVYAMLLLSCCRRIVRVEISIDEMIPLIARGDAGGDQF